MTVDTATATTARPPYRDFLPTLLWILGGIALLLWMIWGHGWQHVLAWDPVLFWFLTIVLLTGCMIAIGQVGTGHWLGILINSRFKMSLSRLQIVLWTILVLSAYTTIVVHRMSGNLATMDADAKATCQKLLGKTTFTAEECGGGAINIQFPSELLVAMGISAASFAGTTIIQSSKRGKKVDIQAKDDHVSMVTVKLNEAVGHANELEAQLQTRRRVQLTAAAEMTPGDDTSERIKAGADKEYNVTAAELQAAKEAVEAAQKEYDQAVEEQKKAEMEADGLLHKNASVADAKLEDLFKGDEVANSDIIDLSKVQMFFLTLIVVVIYGAAVASTLHRAEVLNNAMVYNFPSFSDTLNSLLAISHGTYLSVKTADHTKTAA